MGKDGEEPNPRWGQGLQWESTPTPPVPHRITSCLIASETCLKGPGLGSSLHEGESVPLSQTQHPVGPSVHHVA